MSRCTDESNLSFQLVSERLRYDPETGFLYSKVRKLGKRVGWVNNGKYLKVFVNGFSVYAHRVCWLLATGAWPEGVIDHINGDPSDNRLCNLRDCTQQENSRNSTVKATSKSGLKGASWHGRSGTWRAKICVEGRQICLGQFNTPEEASACYAKAAAEHYGDFARVAVSVGATTSTSRVIVGGAK